jgi:hypothetical protein
MKFGAGYLYKDLSNKFEFRENRLRDIHTLVNDASEISPYFEHFYPTGQNSEQETFTKMH